MRSLAIVPVLLLAGCAKGSLPLNMSQYTPKLAFQDVEVDSVDFTRAQTQFVFRIDNPNPIGLSVASFAYDLDLAGSGFLDGDSSDGLTLAPNGSAEFKLPVSVVFADVLQLVQNLDNQDEVPFAFSGNFGFQTPLGVLRVPFSEEGNLPVLHAPKLNIRGARVDEFKPLQNRATLSVDLGITHKGKNSVSLGGFDYGLTLGGQTIADGIIAELATVSAGQEQNVTVPVNLSLVGMGSSIISAISQRGPVDIGLTAGLVVDTPFGPIPLNVNEQASVNLR